MVHLFALLVPRDGMTPLAFHHHWRYAHGPLAGRIRQAHAYQQSHRLPMQPTDLPILPHGGTAEVWFKDFPASMSLGDDPDYADHAAHDEDNFHHMDRMEALHCTEHVVLAGPPIRKDTGGVKVMQFVRRAPGLSPDEFRSAWLGGGETEELTALRATRCVRGAQVPEKYTGDDPRFDGLLELWWPDQWAFEANRALEPEAWTALISPSSIDPAGTGFLVTSEHRQTWPDPS